MNLEAFAELAGFFLWSLGLAWFSVGFKRYCKVRLHLVLLLAAAVLLALLSAFSMHVLLFTGSAFDDSYRLLFLLFSSFAAVAAFLYADCVAIPAEMVKR